jgi:putative pyoverdin transport system ATP-binding/permease protein
VGIQVIKVLYDESPKEWNRVLSIAALAGLTNAGVLWTINHGAAQASADSSMANLRLLLLLLICLVTFFIGKRFALIQASVLVERMVRDRLMRIFNRVRGSELHTIENLGRGELYTKITQNTSLISQSGFILVNAAQQAFVLFFCICYIAYLSVPAFLATVAAIVIGTVIYMRHTQSMDQLLKRLANKEAELLDTLAHIVDGFAEIRLNRSKSDAIFRKFSGVSDTVCGLKIDAQVSFCIDIMFADMFFYVLLSVVVFLLPRVVPTYGSVVLMITAAILFIIGPLQMVVQAAPVFERAQSALARIAELEEKLKEGMRSGSDEAPVDFSDFTTVELAGAAFAYPEEDGSSGFRLGPVNLTIHRGELVFLAGGNGSGKTTLLKLLCGLYSPTGGAICVDGATVQEGQTQSYRELYGTIFNQFHLFDQLYGLENIDREKVLAAIDEMQLSQQTSFDNGRLTHLNLSTGQRKRLALAVTLLEGKDFFIFDEWAADQDPHFRKHFYEVLLARLKNEGKTVIAATHDDRYWALADRVVHLEYGKITDNRQRRNL